MTLRLVDLLHLPPWILLKTNHGPGDVLFSVARFFVKEFSGLFSFVLNLPLSTPFETKVSWKPNFEKYSVSIFLMPQKICRLKKQNQLIQHPQIFCLKEILSGDGLQILYSTYFFSGSFWHGVLKFCTTEPYRLVAINMTVWLYTPISAQPIFFYFSMLNPQNNGLERTQAWFYIKISFFL